MTGPDRQAVPAAGPDGPVPSRARTAPGPGAGDRDGPAANPVGAPVSPERTRYNVLINRWTFGAGIFLVYLISPVLDLFHQPSVAVRVVGVTLALAFCALYLFAVPRCGFGTLGRFRIHTAVAMTAIVAAYLAVCGAGGIRLCIYLAVSLMLLLPRWLGAVAVAALALMVAALPASVPSWGLAGWQWQTAGGLLLGGLVAGAVRANSRTREQLDVAQVEIEHLAAERERLRIARDLHDLLGHALTTMTVKSELASRLVQRDPVRAAAEMAQVAELSRQSLADVRATVVGYRGVNLARELATAREVLAAAGIESVLPASVEEVPGPKRELFAWAVREGVTNAVRHSRARHVWITLSPTEVEIVNDGAGGADDPDQADAPGGVGLAGLSERAASAGAVVSAGRDGSGRFRLAVAAPG